MTGRRWLAAILAVGLLLGSGGAAPAAVDAVAVTGSACPGTSGVTVVVDFTALGGGVRIGCAAGSPSSGLDALAKAGFSVAQSQNFPGAVCRIDGLPGAGQQDCVNMPPPNAYWGYWHANRGGTWTYSSTGAGSWHPAQGSVEGWAFETDGNLLPPSVPPPAAPKPTPKPTPRPTPKPTAAPTARPATAAPTATAAATVAPATPSASAAPSTADQPSLPPSAAPTSAAPSFGALTAAAQAAAASDPPGTSAAPDAAGPPGDASGSGAPPVGTLIGLGLVVALLVGGGLLARRGGRPEP